MARTPVELPKGSRITDYISLGVLAKTFPDKTIRRILASTGRESVRRRDLPAHVVVYYVSALALFRQSSHREVLRCLLERLQWLESCAPWPIIMPPLLPWPTRSTPKCPAIGRRKCRTSSTMWARRSKAVGCWCWAWPTRRTSTICASRRLDIIHLLQAKGATVSYHDPQVPSFHYDGMEMTGVEDLTATLDAVDCVVIATDHAAYDWADIARRSSLITDTRHVATT